MPVRTTTRHDKLAASAGERLRALRVERGMTQDELAQAVGVSRSAVAQWETDRSGQLRANITRIAASLDVSVDVLLHGHESHAASGASTGDELALLRLYRVCNSEDRAYLLRTAKLLSASRSRSIRS